MIPLEVDLAGLAVRSLARTSLSPRLVSLVKQRRGWAMESGGFSAKVSACLGKHLTHGTYGHSAQDLTCRAYGRPALADWVTSCMLAS